MSTWWQREIPDVCCKCNPRWHAMGRRFPWCIRFNSWMRPFAASRSNRCGVSPTPQTATRRGSRFGSAKDADVIVNLTLEGIPVDETVDLQGPKEMSDSMADAALRNFLAESERRRERSPIRTAENTAKDVHHNAQAVAFMSAPVAIRTER